MSIRIRQSGGMTIALCAAETDAEPGDRYIDDAEHYALAAKFAHDWQGQTVSWKYDEEWAEIAQHKKRDAVEELNKWLVAQGIEAGTAETVEQGSVHESPVAESDAPKDHPKDHRQTRSIHNG